MIITNQSNQYEFPCRLYCYMDQLRSQPGCALQRLRFDIHINENRRHENFVHNFINQVKRVIRGGLRRLLGFTWISASLYERDLINEPLPEVKPRIPFQFTYGELHHIELFQSVLTPKKLKSYKQRLLEDKIWLLAFVEGEVANSSWVSYKDEFEPNTGTWVHLAQKDAYLFDSFTMPELWGYGLETAMTTQRMITAKEHGAQRALAIVFTNNPAERHVMAKLGLREKERILTIRFLGRKFVRRYGL